MHLNFRKINSPLGLYMVLEQLHIWHSQYPRGQCTRAAVECCGLEGGAYAGHKAHHTCTSWYAYAAMFSSSSIVGLGHISAMLQAHSELKGGGGGQGYQQRLPMCCCGIKNLQFITRNSEAEIPSGMPGAELSPADKMCNSSATSTLCTGCAGTSPMYHRTSVLPRPLGLDDRP